VHAKLKDYENSITYFSQVWELVEAKYGRKSEEVGKIYLELAKVHVKKKDFEEGINYQKKALEVYQDLEGYGDSDHIANIAITLSEWLEKAERIDEALVVMKQAEQIYEYNYSVVDKRTCKVKRNISLLYLKSNKYEEALEELKEVEVSFDYLHSVLIISFHYRS
jgi:tetratricopeptide (TPR) repeat protein